MTQEEFLGAIRDLLARPVENLSTEAKAEVAQECIGKLSDSSSWLSSQLLGHLWMNLWMIGLPFLALLTRLDWWVLLIIWVLAASGFFLIVLLQVVDLRKAGATPRITEDEFRSVLHHLLAQPVDNLSVEDKAEAFHRCLVDMKQNEKPPWWSRAMNSLLGYSLIFAGVATAAALFPRIEWFWWLGLGILLGVLVAVLLCLILIGVKWLVMPAGQQPPAKGDLGEQTVDPGVDA